jgi:adenosyl cobinamide kinase/adenosyl cobinamide phosphate guanylyltransferase
MGSVPLRRYVRVAAVAVLLVAILSGTLAMATDQMTHERDANRAVTDVLADDEYESLTLVSVRATVPVVNGEYGVTVVLERPADRPYPELADRLYDEIAERTGRDVPVTVEFVDTLQSTP